MTIFPKKSFGQHWLKNAAVMNKIVAAAEIKHTDRVVEVGPGRGALTKYLVEKAKQVVVVEADRDLIEPLQKKFGDKIDIIHADVKKVSNRDLVSPCSLLHTHRPKECKYDRVAKRDTRYKLVGNLPYNIASAIVVKFLVEDPRPTRMVVMVQKEVADRMLAKPGDMGVLSVICQLYANIKRVTNVKPGSFHPPPQVDSTVLQFDPVPVSRKKLRPLEAEAIIHLAKAGFANRRKQLSKNLSTSRIIGADRAKEILKSLKLPETARAQELSVEQWISLYRAVSKLK
ncbi:MAG: 16S rRNA (adenine(1518)-N(6)/adenine(1519)-N(6))-dimethyltransferase RsmA [Candidatus Uhrbacteria bacterium]|nr:ribosomal RNA small subunit methyltransferase A [Patescibacteria group bacterium]MBU1906522.1 ribosomal RNA small subunit methyltransferase A [Patescibacteria group bacterium]